MEYIGLPDNWNKVFTSQSITTCLLMFERRGGELKAACLMVVMSYSLFIFCSPHLRINNILSCSDAQLNLRDTRACWLICVVCVSRTCHVLRGFPLPGGKHVFTAGRSPQHLSVKSEWMFVSVWVYCERLWVSSCVYAWVTVIHGQDAVSVQ